MASDLDAVYTVREYIGQKSCIAGDRDLAKFFDTVNHEVLMCRVARKIHAKRVRRVIGKYRRAGVGVNSRLQAPPKGVPQRGPRSPILSNVLVDEYDKELERRKHKFVRSADDSVILVKRIRAGNRVMQSMRRCLEKKLKLKIHQEKSSVLPTDHLESLGVVFKKSKIRWSEKACHACKKRLKKFTGRSWGVSMQSRLEKLSRYFRGWMNYFGISEYYRPIPELDHWLRRRVRMCSWKQWRPCRTKVRNLVKRGVSRETAMSVGMSRKGDWHLARTLATQAGMTNQWLKEQGLISIKELWVNMHYPATAR